MTQTQQTIGSALRWNTDVEWRSEPRSDDLTLLIFYRAGAAILKFEVSLELVEVLADYQPSVPHPAARDPEFQAFLSLLREHRILVEDEPATGGVCLSLYSDATTVFATWHLPSERALAVDLLVGDEALVHARFKEFSAARPADHLTSFIKIYYDTIDIGPLRYPYEAPLPTTRSAVPMHYGAWQQRLSAVTTSLKDFFAEGVASTKWHARTTHGSRLAWIWEEAKSPYRVTATTMSQLSESVPFFHWRAQVEAETGAGGVGTTVVAAEFCAQCEAWERYCLSRPDLAISAESLQAEDLRSFPGMHFNYLRRLSKPITNAPAFSIGWTLAGHRPIKVPTEWIYFNGPNSVANSNGAAFGASLADAAFGAKIEVVERHLLMQTYLQLAQAEEFVPDEDVLDGSIRAFLRIHHRRVRFYDLGECNKIHAVVCVLGADLPPYASIGCSGKSSREEATKKALYEAVVTDSQWSRRIEQLGPKQFVQKGLSYLQAPSQQVGFEESAWYWAARSDAEQVLHSRFNTGTPAVQELAEDRFVAVDIGQTIVPTGAVVKVVHPDALPLPSCFAQALTLFELLQRNETLPIPMF